MDPFSHRPDPVHAGLLFRYIIHIGIERGPWTAAISIIVILGLDPRIGVSVHNLNWLEGRQYALRVILGSSPTICTLLRGGVRRAGSKDSDTELASDRSPAAG
jgi:hypothetical protein